MCQKKVGMDVANHVRNFLAAADLGVRMTGGGSRGNPMQELVDMGCLGKKTKKGFFVYEVGESYKMGGVDGWMDGMNWLVDDFVG